MIKETVTTTEQVQVQLTRGVATPQSAWVKNLAEMHDKFGVHPVVAKMDKDQLTSYMQFRISMLQEELDELKEAKTADDAVDAILDLCVFAIGTLDVFQVNADESWNRIHAKNMEKEAGIKEGRPNPLGFPDMLKPAGWTAPAHHDNVGKFAEIYPN